MMTYDKIYIRVYTLYIYIPTLILNSTAEVMDAYRVSINRIGHNKQIIRIVYHTRVMIIMLV